MNCQPNGGGSFKGPPYFQSPFQFQPSVPSIPGSLARVYAPKSFITSLTPLATALSMPVGLFLMKSPGRERMSADDLSNVISVIALLVSLLALVQASRPSLTVSEVKLVGTHPSTYRIKVANLGDQGAQHAVVSLLDNHGNEIGVSAGKALHSDTTEEVDVLLNTDKPQFPLTPRLNWRWLGFSWSKTSTVRIQDE